jgi:hypothetical protein
VKLTLCLLFAWRPRSCLNAISRPASPAHHSLDTAHETRGIGHLAQARENLNPTEATHAHVEDEQLRVRGKALYSDVSVLPDCIGIAGIHGKIVREMAERCCAIVLSAQTVAAVYDRSYSC